MECAFQTGQDAQIKVTENLAQRVKELRAIVDDFTSRYFQLTFTPGRNRLLPQSFDHTFYRREESPSPILYAARHTFFHSTLPLPSLSSLVFPPRRLDYPASCAFLVPEALEKNKEVPK